MLDDFRAAHALREASVGHHLRLMGVALPYFRQAHRILEIGPGRARFAQDCLRDKAVTFYEPYEGAASALEATKPPQWQVMRCDAREGLTGGPYDVVYASHLIEHLTPEQLYKFLQDCDRVLAPGGYLVLAAPMLWAHFYCDITHRQPYMPHTIARAMTGGFGDMTWAPISDRYTVVREAIGYEEDYTREGRVQVHPVWERPFLASRWWVVDGLLAVCRALLRRCGVRLVRHNSWLLVLRKSA